MLNSYKARALAVAAAIILAAASAGQALALTDLRVDVSGLRNYKGRVVLVLWAATDHTSEFPHDDKVQLRDERPGDASCDFPKVAVCRRTVESLQHLTVSYTFRDLPEGDYAVFVFHDENSNGVLDRGLLSRPLEARGYSQVLPDDLNPWGATVGFYKARFALGAPKTIVIGLRYPPLRPR
jgi:uncharacterized protein (DUF2141 family)